MTSQTIKVCFHSVSISRFLGVFSWCDLLLWKSQLFWIWLLFFLSIFFWLLLVLILVQILPTFYISFKKSQVFWQSMGSGRNVLFTTTFLDDGKNVLALTSKRLLDFVCVKLFDWKKISLYRDGVILPLSVIKMILKFVANW